jgi:hypothetical protein
MKRLPNKIKGIFPDFKETQTHYSIGDEVDWNFIPGQIIWTNTIDTVWVTVDANGNTVPVQNI